MRGEGPSVIRLRLKCDGTRAETRFRLSAKRTSQFKSAGASVQSTTGNRGVRISVRNAGYTMFRGSVRVLATHSIRQFPLHFPFRASPCAIAFQLDRYSAARGHYRPRQFTRQPGRNTSTKTVNTYLASEEFTHPTFYKNRKLSDGLTKVDCNPKHT
jgi:hypothetical protein